MVQEMNAREVHALEFIAGLDAQLNLNEKYLEARLRSIPDGWRQYRIARSAVERVIDRLYDTAPTKTLMHMRRLCEYGEVVLRPKRQAVKTDDVQIVPTEDLKMLINKVMSAECAICLKDAREVKACPLRKALMRIAPPQEISKSGCAYADVAQECGLGEYI